MRLIRNLKLALRLLVRDWRAGELKLFVAALVIAVGAVTAVGFFNDRMLRGMAYQSAEMLGADLVLASPQPVPPEWLGEAEKQGLTRSEALEFASVVVKGERLQLSSVRAVGAHYPPRGVLRTAAALYAPDAVAEGVPAPGAAWVEARVLHALAAAVGDRIEIGNAELTVTRVLTYEPGRGGNFFALAPRVLIHRADVARTRVIQPGSRVTYGYAFAGAEEAVARYQRWLKTRLGPNHQLVGAREGNASVARALERVDRYIGLTSLLAVILAGVAIAMGARRYSRRHYDMSAMLRCLGASQRDIVQLYLPQLLALGLGASLIGVALGWAAQETIHYLMRDFFPLKLPAPGAAPALFGVATGLITLAGFALAPILRLKAVPPLRVLRREAAPLPPSSLAVYGSAAGAIVLLMWRYTASWTLTLGVLAGAVAAAAALAAAAFGLLALSKRLHQRVGTAWRFGFNNLWRRAHASVGQILAFGLTLMAMAVIALVRTDLLSTWQRQLPADTPNHFAFNILAADVPAVRHFFAANRIEAQALYPMVRGRLTTIAGVPVTQAVTKEERSDEALQRELNLSWAAHVPPDNTLVRGEWWDSEREQGAGAPRGGDATVASRSQPPQATRPGRPGTAQRHTAADTTHSGGGGGARVSVEEKLAKKLGIELGAELGFSIGGEEVKARVASIRKVQWDSFHPNFYMIFPPGMLEAHPATYLTSFYLSPEQKPLLTALVRAFPAVTVLETDQVLAQARTILGQVSFAVEFVLLFVLAAGFVVLYAALAASLDERFHEGALLRTLGASRRQLRAGHLAEFATLGLLAGLLAAIGTELTAYALYTRAFDLEYAIKWPVWLIAPVAGAVLVGLTGFFGTRRVVARSPLTVLRET